MPYVRVERRFYPYCYARLILCGSKYERASLLLHLGTLGLNLRHGIEPLRYAGEGGLFRNIGSADTGDVLGVKPRVPKHMYPVLFEELSQCRYMGRTLCELAEAGARYEAWANVEIPQQRPVTVKPKAQPSFDSNFYAQPDEADLFAGDMLADFLAGQ